MEMRGERPGVAWRSGLASRLEGGGRSLRWRWGWSLSCSLSSSLGCQRLLLWMGQKLFVNWSYNLFIIYPFINWFINHLSGQFRFDERRIMNKI